MKLLRILKKARVVKGAGRGKRLGVPTINLFPSSLLNLPEGVYVCRVFSPFKYWGVLHFGPRPTFGEEDLSLEIFLFDFDKTGEVPKFVDVEIFSLIRKIRKFESPFAMVKQVDQDILTAKKIIEDFSKEKVSTEVS